ncbi:DUF1993 domain-containing protein [Natrinema altunense]|uniref:Uncharacterized protein n=1 Tax=Natrinema altunense (strain JCM 12890 / CGMCC 1.3731 / AJ2) TaxID=1227494 RepID=M0A2A1_NATA2|nr:hypothetical protein [Natrinema altunense]ELY91977.1 hypothetical protein C485_00500 [Natrinema altunense JCM 12890]
MRVLAREPYSYILLESDGEWILTFLFGRAVMWDVSVRLTDTEVVALEDGEISIADLIERFSADSSTYEGRQITPAVRPDKDDSRD